MRMPAYLAALFLSLFLTACGGGGDSVVNESTTEADGTDGADTDGIDTGDVTTSSSIGTPSIGTGSGDSFQAGTLTVNTTSLSAGGSTQITATIVDAGNENKKIVSEEYTVIFNSGCTSEGRAEFSKDEVTTSSAEVTVTYTAKGCAGDDFITFSLYPSGSSGSDERLGVASGTITVAPAEVGELSFIDYSAPAISISTIGNNVLPKTTSITYNVSDTSGNPIANKTVDFALISGAGDVSLALESSVTNEEGNVSVVVRAGTTHTIFSVIATTIGTDGSTLISTSSLPISVTTGIPDQDSFDISVDVLNPGAYDFNGEVVNVTVFAGDQFNNPVPDGTVVNFAAESGNIEGQCSTVRGVCSVEWLSSGDRPGSHDVGLGRVNDLDPQFGNSVLGMTTIVAYTLGESGYTDANANGVYDTGELFVSYPEAFQDDNANGSLDTGEKYFDFDVNGSYDAAPTTYQGALCSPAANDAGHCESYVHVRDSMRIVQSNRYAVNIRFFEEISANVFSEIAPPALGTSGSFYVLLQDNNGNIPADGTKIITSGKGYNVYSFNGDMPSGTGELAYLGAAGLPSYGYFFSFSYSVDVDPDSVTVGTELNGVKSSVTLF